jgi:hypothetical protein
MLMVYHVFVMLKDENVLFKSFLPFSFSLSYFVQGLLEQDSLIIQAFVPYLLRFS